MINYYKYLSPIVAEQLKSLIGQTLISVQAPQITTSPLEKAEEYIAPWICIALQEDQKRQYLNLCEERCETATEYDYHQLKLFLSDKAVNVSSLFPFEKFDVSYLPVSLMVWKRIQAVKVFRIFIDSAKENIQSDCIIRFDLSDEKSVLIYPESYGKFVSTGMVTVVLGGNNIDFPDSLKIPAFVDRPFRIEEILAI